MKHDQLMKRSRHPVTIDSTDVAIGLLAAWEGRVFPDCRSNGLSYVTLHGWLHM